MYQRRRADLRETDADGIGDCRRCAGLRRRTGAADPAAPEPGGRGGEWPRWVGGLHFRDSRAGRSGPRGYPATGARQRGGVRRVHGDRVLARVRWGRRAAEPLERWLLADRAATPRRAGSGPQLSGPHHQDVGEDLGGGRDRLRGRQRDVLAGARGLRRSGRRAGRHALLHSSVPACGAGHASRLSHGHWPGARRRARAGPRWRLASRWRGRSSPVCRCWASRQS